MKVYIFTQVHENYGAHDWAGKGPVPQYWKAKGGQDYYLPLEGFRAESEFAEKNLRMIVDGVRQQIESNDEFFQETILGYELVDDDYMTEFESSQLEYEGFIRFPTKVLEAA
jgi:hypothetical protein